MNATLRRALIWRWTLIAAVFLPCAVVSVLLVEMQPEEHEAVSVFAVVPESLEGASTTLIQLTVDRYVVILQSEQVLARVARETGEPIGVRSAVSVAAEPESANLRVVASAATARQARALADAVAAEAVRMGRSDSMMDGVILAPATDRAPPLTASPRALQGVLVLIALAVALLLAYTLELLRPRIRTDEDVEAVVGVPLLGSLPSLAGRSPFANVGGNADSDVVDAARELRQGFLTGGRDGRPGGTTLVLGVDRGAGSSTVAFWLARSAATQGESVVLMDAELERAGLSAHLGLPRAIGLDEVLARPELLGEAVDEVGGVAVVGTRPGLDAGNLRGERLGEVLKVAAAGWDRVIVDTSVAQAPDLAEAMADQPFDVLLVVGLGTPVSEVLRAVQRLRRLDLPVRGVALNRPPRSGARRWSPARPVTRSPVVLMYHGFSAGPRSDDPENLFVEIAAFEQQLQWLLDHNWTPLDLDGFLAAKAGRRTPRKCFVVTIDDGYRSVMELAAPVLRRLEVPALLFAPTGLVGRSARWLPMPPDEPLMTRKQLRSLQQDFPIEIGVHGWDHRDLRGLDPVELHRQVDRARTELSTILGRDVRCLAYPYGGHDAEARAAAERSGVEIAFSVFEDDGPFAVSRVDVNATDTSRSFRVKLLPYYRRVWTLLEHAPWVRRSVRRLAAARPRQGR